MGRRGPKGGPPPADDKPPEGEPKRKAPASIDDEDDAAIVAAPKQLKGEALAAWKLLAPLLRRLRAQDGSPLLTGGSRHALAMYCDAWADWLKAVAKIEEEGSILESATGYQYPHPAVGMKKTAAGTIRQLGQEFGLTPANRVAMGVSAAEKSALDEFMGATA